MAILYPPLLEGKLPAQYGTELHIPYYLNRAVGESEVQLVNANIKSIATNSIVSSVSASSRVKTKEGYMATFVIGSDTLKVGQYYKIQLAFGNTEGMGAFSTLGVFKYTSKPKVTIIELEGENKQISYAQGNYTGSYENENDPQEKVYEYQFDLLLNGTIIESSGRQLHDARNDTETKASVDAYKMRRRLNPQTYYQLRYTVYTVNGLEISSNDYFITQAKTFKANKEIEIGVTAQPDQGAIDVNFNIMLKYNGQDSAEEIYGKYKVYRSSSLDEYSYWDELGEVTLDYQYTFTEEDKKSNGIDENNEPTYPKVRQEIKAFQDRTIEHGVKYKYALQQFDEELDIYATKDESEEISCDYVDAFLSDGEQALKVKFNPKVSSFKTTKLESKLETIGGEFPFIFRNGHTNYKEFSISGLISYLMDDYNLFDNTNEDEISRDQTSSAALIDNSLETQMRRERQFKLKVLDWLNDGKPKLFRSPTEGNYIVRLINVSLSPNEQLGRMLHTFSATAYEIAEHNYENLLANGFIGMNHYRVESSFETEIRTDEYLKPTRLILKDIRSIDITSTKGALFTLTYADGTPLNIEIGYSGRYVLEAPESNPITSIQFDPSWYSVIKVKYSGHTSYPIIHKALQDSTGNEFGEERKIVKIGSAQKFNQIFGPCEDILSKLKAQNGEAFLTSSNHAVDCQIENVLYIRIYTKPVILTNEPGAEVYENADNFDRYIFAKQNGETIQYFSSYSADNALNSDAFKYIVKSEEQNNNPAFEYSNSDYQLGNSKDILNMTLFDTHLNKAFSEENSIIAIGDGLVAEIFYDVFLIEHAAVEPNEVAVE